MAKKILIGFLFCFGILVMTNPTMDDFYEYKGISRRAWDKVEGEREVNFLIFSIYSFRDRDDRYVGILKNFIKI